ncbi:hypothetical protein DYQ86_23620 [Acidobacteria bacterium AB60]|nr:hypothetical protein DYQ86_23620 [Acidobacteria bacterium AB60]
MLSRMEKVATPLANPLRSPQSIANELERGRRLGLLGRWHLASLDAPTVAVVWAWAFAWTVRIPLPAWPLALLGLAVWAIYVGDRLLDARAGGALQERHRFHWRHRRILAPLAAGAALAAAAIARRRVPALALPQDSAVALATLAYFSGVHGRIRLPQGVRRLMEAAGSREGLVGGLFAAGCLLPAWSVDPVGFPLPRLVLPAIYFSALAWLNVRAITCWETEGLRLGRTADVLAGAGVLLAVGLASWEPRAAAMVALGAMSAALVGWLDRRRDADPVGLRAAVDLVLLTPLLLVLAR